MNDTVHIINSPCFGRIEQIMMKQLDYVYEWEKLFLIRTSRGTLEEITVGYSGSILSLDVEQGEDVTPATVLARLKDDLLITGSD